ncbi:hypothetical protein AVEN_164889-1 [Araneus ventricosus]|uniref:Uncharacterized protein n=1 Tax=Araneus ventricosus TaxID=182803 RepID=A0A4Y2DT62_ARAVE|nr:hypothetical protein AVEN_164889-1 [Araneus ventricosus]
MLRPTYGHHEYGDEKPPDMVLAPGRACNNGSFTSVITYLLQEGSGQAMAEHSPFPLWSLTEVAEPWKKSAFTWLQEKDILQDESLCLEQRLITKQLGAGIRDLSQPILHGMFFIKSFD